MASRRELSGDVIVDELRDGCSAYRDLAANQIGLCAGLTPSTEQQTWIAGCHDPATLDAWIDRALAAMTLDDVFGSPAP